MHYFREISAALSTRNAADILLFGGGIVPDQDLDELAGLGVGRIFTPSSSTNDVVAYVRHEINARRSQAV